MSALVYIAGPYTANTIDQVNANVKRAEEVGQQVLSMGLIPIIPHKLSSHWDRWGILVNKPHDWWLENFCIPLLRRCDGALFIEGWTSSLGARHEHSYCQQMRIPRFFSISELEHLSTM